MKLSSIRKFLIACVGAAGVLLTQGLVHGSAAHILTGAIAVADAFTVYLVPNSALVPLV